MKELQPILNTSALKSLKVYYSKTKKITIRQVLPCIFHVRSFLDEFVYFALVQVCRNLGVGC